MRGADTLSAINLDTASGGKATGATMGGSTPYKEPMGETNEVGRVIKAGFQMAMPPQRLLRAEQLYRRNQVIVLNENKLFNPAEGCYTLKAKILSQHHESLAPGGAYTTSIQFIPMTSEKCECVRDIMFEKESKLFIELANATRQGRDPRVDPEFKDAATVLMSAASKGGLQFYSSFIPFSWTHAANAECECLDYKMDKEWCKHIGALGYLFLDKCEQDPFLLFEVRGLDVPSLFSGPHAPPKRPRETVVIDDEEPLLVLPTNRANRRLRRTAPSSSSNNPISLHVPTIVLD